MAARVTAAISEFLSRHSGERVELRPDLDQVPALASEREAQWRRVSEADFLTVGEKRALLGLPRQPDEE
jgi:phage portal protein BeeE